MSFSTLSGPLRSGTVRYGTVLGGRNTGIAMLVQQFDTGDLTGTTAATYNTRIGNLPAGSVIYNVAIDVVVAAGTGTTTVAIGSASAGAQFFAATDVSAGGRFPTGLPTTAQILVFQTSLTADTAVWFQNVVAAGTLSAGRIVITVEYLQRGTGGIYAPTTVQV